MARERHEIKQTTNPGKHDFPCVIMGEVVDGGLMVKMVIMVVAASGGMAMGTEMDGWVAGGRDRVVIGV